MATASRTLTQSPSDTSVQQPASSEPLRHFPSGSLRPQSPSDTSVRQPASSEPLRHFPSGSRRPQPRAANWPSMQAVSCQTDQGPQGRSLCCSQAPLLLTKKPSASRHLFYLLGSDQLDYDKLVCLAERPGTGPGNRVGDNPLWPWKCHSVLNVTYFHL